MRLTDKGRFETALGAQGELSRKYRAFLDTVNETSRLPERVRRLCRARIRLIHDLEPGDVAGADLERLASGDFSDFPEAERCALAVAERIPYQHHALQDEEVQAVTKAYGPDGTVALLTFLAFADASCRLTRTFSS